MPLQHAQIVLVVPVRVVQQAALDGLVVDAAHVHLNIAKILLLQILLRLHPINGSAKSITLLIVPRLVAFHLQSTADRLELLAQGRGNVLVLEAAAGRTHVTVLVGVGAAEAAAHLAERVVFSTI